MPKHPTAVACLSEGHPIFAVPPLRALFVALFTVMVLGTTFTALRATRQILSRKMGKRLLIPRNGVARWVPVTPDRSAAI
jgi:hypothetical protein